MPKLSAEGLAELIESLGRVERESEEAYLALGRFFPLLASEMTKSADAAERSLVGIKSLLSRGYGRESREGDSAAFFRDLHDRDTAFLARLNDSTQRLGSLDEVIARIRGDSEEMEIISLNAMTAALKSGAEGKAFSVITDELKRLSGSTITLADSVTGIGHSLLESFSRLGAALAELDSFRSDYFASLDAMVTRGFGEIERDLVSASDFFGELLAEARRVREPVMKVMQDIQLQDILRQSLQHVAISLREAETAAASEGASAAASASEGDSAFAAAVIELTLNLLDDVGAKLGSGAESFGRDMEEVRSIVESCLRRRDEYLSTALRAASVDSNRLSEGSVRYHSLKRGVISAARRLADQVRLLDDSFKGISALLSRFQTIVVASRIEVAKTRQLRDVGTTVRGMIELTDRIEADVGGALATTKEFIKVAIAAIADYAAADEDSGERLSGALAKVESGAELYVRASGEVRGQIEAFTLYTPLFIRRLEEVGGELDKLSGLRTSLGSIRADLAGLLSGLGSGIGASVSGEQSERLRQMVERFTIFTHKKVAGEIGKFAVEAGSAAGEITLF